MKRYLVPLTLIVVIASLTYAWTSHRANKANAMRGRRAHQDSVRLVNAKKPAPTYTEPSRDTETLSLYDEEHPAPITDAWIVEHYGLPADSIRPERFVAPKAVLDPDEVGEYLPILFDTSGYPNVDTASTIDAQGTEAFTHATVLAMLKRHLKSPIDAEEFSRCPSGYWVTTDTVAPDGWRYGGVYYGQGCNDTLLCDIRLIYAKRWIEIKDHTSRRFLSLRTYEALKFGSKPGEAIKPKSVTMR